MPYAGHSTAKPFAGSLYLRRLLDVCLTHDMVGLRALYKEVKPRSPSRPFLIATAAMQRHPGVALRIIEQKSHLTSSLPWDNLRARILDKYDPATASHSPALQPCKKLRA
jgi:hypothetical protein